MSGLLNGFNNGRDATDGIGGQKPIDQLTNGDDKCTEPAFHKRIVSNNEVAVKSCNGCKWVGSYDRNQPCPICRDYEYHSAFD